MLASLNDWELTEVEANCMKDHKGNSLVFCGRFGKNKGYMLLNEGRS